MHDFLLAKEIVDSIMEISRKDRLGKIKTVRLEVGGISLAHDGLPEHLEEVTLENLEFALENIAVKSRLNGAKFEIKRVPGESWKIVNFEIE